MSAKKGIVLESNHGWSTVLMEGGHYRKVRQSLEVGEIYYETTNKIIYYSKYAAAAVLALILLGAMDFFNVVAYANVSTGVEMGVNRWNRVVSVNYTDDTENVPAGDLDLKGQKIEDAIVMVIQETAQKHDPAAIKIEVTSKNENNLPLEEQLMRKVETSIGGMSSSNHKGQASYQRQGKAIEIEDLEKLVPKSSSSKSKRKNSDQNDSSHGNKANNNKKINGSPSNQYKDRPTKGQMEQTDRTDPLNNRGTIKQGTPAPSKDKANNEDNYKERGTGQTKAKSNNDNSKAKEKPSPANNSGKGNNKNKSPN